ncbi:MAG: peptide ABC transporter ATP-binding protein [Spirochaetaceae bacterium 4572_7]|nr:MAG: peptide ABC transporter ATP-binding protein [Spirochaetaceae bacterium 4572_7]
MDNKNILIETNNLHQYFNQGRGSKGTVHALNGISLQVFEGETLGLVGETGCGKSTFCRSVMRIYKPTKGSILFEGKDITNLPERKLKKVRQSMQMIFQDPAESMNSRVNVGYVIEEPLIIQTKMTSAQRKERAYELLQLVGLPKDSYDRYPHEFSGGQRQRIAIARALALDPKIIVCDEAVSALDVSIQAQVLNLLLDLQRDRKLTLIFISHDLSVVRHMSDRVAVMYLGNVMEISSSKRIYEEAKHPYTTALISAIPQPDPTKKNKVVPNTGEIPSPIDLPTGCPFHMNCPKCMDICKIDKPELKEVSPEHFIACHLY